MNRIVATLVIAAALGGCATYQQGRAYWTLNESDFAAIQPGSTTKSDVEQLMGRPLMSMRFANLGEEVWDYRFLGGTRVYVAEIHFDTAGRTKYYTTYLDRCPQHPDGCRD